MMRTTIEDRILLHLSRFRSHYLDRKVPEDISQKGIAETVDGSRSRVSRILRKMIKKDLIKEEKKYLKRTQNRKRKIYSLTVEGKKKAKDLRKKLKQKKIEIKTLDGKKKVKLSEMENYVKSENTLLDVLVKMNGENILDLTDQHEMKEPDFVNRRKELKKLKDTFENVKNDGCKAIFIAGQAGIGKSTMVDKFKQEISDDVIFFQGKGYSQTSDPYLPFKKAFEDFEQSSFLDILSRPKDRDENRGTDRETYEAERKSIFFEFTKEVEKLSERKPLIISLDDLQWGDGASFYLLHYMVDNLSDHPVLFICAYRREDVSNDHTIYDVISRLSRIDKHEDISIEPLKWKHTKKMVHSMLNSESVPSDFINFIHDMSEGNPLFIKEFVELLIEEDKLSFSRSDYPSDLEELKIPQVIEDVLKRRLSIHLSKESINIVEMGSIIGEKIPLTLLRSCLDVDELELLDTIDEVLERDIWKEYTKDNSYLFTHNLVRKVIYEDISALKKKSLHNIVAENIEKIYKDNLEEHHSDLGLHYEKANQLEKGARHYFKAGKTAEKSYAHENAIKMYKKALDLSEEKDRCDILERLGDIHKIRGDHQEAINHYDSVIEKTNDIHLMNNILSKLNEIFLILGDFDQALEKAEEGLTLCEENDNLKCKLLSAKGRVYFRKGDYNRARNIFEEEKKIAEEISDEREIAHAFHHIGAIDIRKGNLDSALESLNKAASIREKIDDKRGLCETLNNLGVVYKRKGDLELALDNFYRGYNIEKKIGNKELIIKSLNNIGIIYKNKGGLDKALEHYEKSLAIAEKIGDKMGVSTTNTNIGNIYEIKGEYDEALHHFKKALKIEKEIGNKSGIAANLNNLGSTYEKKGNLDKAFEYHKKSIRIATEIGNKGGKAGSLYNIGSIHKKKGNFEKALKSYQECYELTKEIDAKRLMVHVLFGLAETWLEIGDEESALEKAHKAVDLSSEIGFERAMGVAHGSLGKVYLKMGRLDEAKKEFDEGIRLLEQLGDETEKAKILYDHSKLLMRQSKKKKAKKDLNDALKKFENKNMDWWVDKCRKALEDI